MSRVLGYITPELPWGASGACTSSCGFCGRCSAAWEREDDDDRCEDCGGSGEVTIWDDEDRWIDVACQHCHGTGDA